MKILIIVNNLEAHGWGRIALSLLKNPGEHKLGVATTNGVFFNTSRNTEDCFSLCQQHITRLSDIDSLDSRMPFLINSVKLLCIVLAYKPDCMVIACEPYARIAGLTRKLLKIKTIFILAGTYASIYSRKKILPIHLSDHYVCISTYTRKISNIDNIGSNSTSVKTLGVDPSEFFPDKTNYDDVNLSKLKNKKFLLFVGRNLKQRKGFQFLIDALIYLESEPRLSNQSITPVVIPGKLNSSNIKILADLNTRLKRFSLFPAGFVSDNDLRRLYTNAALNILPSKPSQTNYEGFGLVHLESASCGTPSVGCYESGNEDACSLDGLHLVKYGDNLALGNLIVKALQLKLINPSPEKVKTESEFAASIYRLCAA